MFVDPYPHSPMRHLTPLLFLLIGIGQAQAQCSESSTRKVLLVGDSWAFFMGVDQTINNVFNKWGHSGYTYFTNLTLAENGAETDDFQGADKQAEILEQLTNNPSIEVVHLSIGGNDVLGDWNVSFTQAQTDSLKAAVYDRLVDVIEFIKDARPGIRILWSGYTYPNFEEVIDSFQPFPTLHPFYGTWEGMGFPSFLQLNTILNDFSNTIADFCANDPQVDFVPATGLMQYTFGQNTPLGVAPGGSYPPLTAPLSEGFVDYPSPRNSMRDYLLTKDCFHLSASGYRDLIEEHTKKFYHKFLMDDAYVVAGSGAQNGSVSNLGNVLSELRVGELGGETYSTLLTFDTTLLPDTGIVGASIFLRRAGLDGTNPIGNTMQVKVKSGFFGSSPNVEAVDLFFMADATDQACRFGSNSTGTGNWIRLDLPSSILPFISNTGSTQFIISTNGAVGGQVLFTDGSDPELAPVLNLRFGEQSVDVAQGPAAAEGTHVFPNPTAGLLNLHTNAPVLGSEVHDALGRLVLQGTAGQGTLDLGALPAGHYTLRIATAEGISMHRVVRQ